MRRCLSVIFLLVLLASPTWAASIDAYPTDPPGARIMDRATASLDATDQKLAYAVLYKLGSLWYVDVYRGTVSEKGADWKHMYRWKLIFQGQKYDPAPVAVLGLVVEDGKAQLFLKEVFKYHEGRVSIYLDWDLKTNRFREDFSD